MARFNPRRSYYVVEKFDRAQTQGDRTGEGTWVHDRSARYAAQNGVRARIGADGSRLIGGQAVPHPHFQTL